MADTQSPKVNMADDDCAGGYRDGIEDPASARRRWNCPGEELLAAYVDGTLGPSDRNRIESHLAKCDFCRCLVSDVVKLQRSDAPPLPFGLLQRAIALAEAKPRRLRWVFVPAGVTVAIAIAVVATLMLRSPEPLVVRTPVPPAAPVIAKSEPPAVHGAAGSDLVRKPRSGEPLPSIIFPRGGSVVARGQIEFRWKAVSRSRYYELRLATSEGDMVWQGQSEKSALKLPGDVTLKDGDYFVWITAYLEDGRAAKSASVRFQVTSSQ